MPTNPGSQRSEHFAKPSNVVVDEMMMRALRRFDRAALTPNDARVQLHTVIAAVAAGYVTVPGSPAPKRARPVFITEAGRKLVGNAPSPLVPA